MDISVVGSGYVGTTLAGCLASLGHNVYSIDIDREIVEQINNGESPIHEPGLQEYISRYSGDNLKATTDYSVAVDTGVTFLALPTPSNEDGSIDTTIIEEATKSLAKSLNIESEDKPRESSRSQKEIKEFDRSNSKPKSSKDSHVVVVKSTVVPGTTEDIIGPILEREADIDVDMASNPEFLREGSAVSDFLDPDKIVFGTKTQNAQKTLKEIYRPLIEEKDIPVVETGIGGAEMIKYANNAFLASKISLINEIGNICKEHNVDSYEVADAIGLDHRVSSEFLRSGVGFGGSCFEKDVKAIIQAARNKDYNPFLLKSVLDVNDKQPKRMIELLEKYIDISGERIAVLGLSFKPGTGDIRNSRAINIIEELLDRDARVVAYDPVAIEKMKELYPDIEYSSSPKNALSGSTAALVVTDWDEFKNLDSEFDLMKKSVVIDGRHIIQKRDGITYEGLTW